MKELIWISSSKKDLLKLPEKSINIIGYGLYLAQMGDKHNNAKVLKGFGAVDVIEIIDQDEHGTYRAVYTLRMLSFVFVLHVFQKKSKHRIKTPKEDMDLINNRIKQAHEIYKERCRSEKK